MKESCLTPQAVEERLQASNVQPTAQRIAIARYVLCEADHPTAKNVKSWADKNFPKMSLATVYNTLGILVKAGLLKKFCLPHSKEAVYDDNVSDHYHFLDEKTGEITDVDPRDVTVTPRIKGLKINEVHMFLMGTKE